MRAFKRGQQSLRCQQRTQQDSWIQRWVTKLPLTLNITVGEVTANIEVRQCVGGLTECSFILECQESLVQGAIVFDHKIQEGKHQYEVDQVVKYRRMNGKNSFARYKSTPKLKQTGCLLF